MKKVKKLLGKLIGLVYEVNTKKDTDIFIDYSPHINGMAIKIYKHGWNDECEGGQYLKSDGKLSDDYETIVVNTDNLQRVINTVKGYL